MHLKYAIALYLSYILENLLITCSKHCKYPENIITKHDLRPAIEEAFSLWFTTSPREVEDLPLHFNPPLPDWMTGNVYQNGLGKFESGLRSFVHPFDAFAKPYTLKLNGSRPANFTTKFLQSQFYRKSIQDNDLAPYLSFGRVTPDFGRIKWLKAIYNGLENQNVNIKMYGHGNNATLIALSDYWPFYEIGQNLETKQLINAKVPGHEQTLQIIPMMSTAHPEQMYDSSDQIALYSSINPLGSHALTVVRIKNDVEREVITMIKMKQVPYIHSFGLTKNYAVVFASPLFISIPNLLYYKWPLHALEWKPQKGTVIYVVDIKSGKVQKFHTGAQLFMHAANGVEVKSGNVLQIDAIVYPDSKILNKMLMKTLLDKNKRNSIPAAQSFRRFRINLKTAKVKVRDFEAQPGNEFINKFEMLKLNPIRKFEKYCYVYGVASKSDSIHLSNVTLVKKDLCSKGSRDASWVKAGHIPGEPVFFPRPGAKKEDDGYLVTVVLNSLKGTSYFAVIHAATMKTVSLAYLPFHVPFVLHGDRFDILYWCINSRIFQDFFTRSGSFRL